MVTFIAFLLNALTKSRLGSSVQYFWYHAFLIWFLSCFTQFKSQFRPIFHVQKHFIRCVIRNTFSGGLGTFVEYWRGSRLQKGWEPLIYFFLRFFWEIPNPSRKAYITNFHKIVQNLLVRRFSMYYVLISFTLYINIYHSPDISQSQNIWIMLFMFELLAAIF